MSGTTVPMTPGHLPGFSTALDALSKFKIDPPNDLWRRVAVLVSPVDLIDLAAVNAPAHLIVSAWKAALDNARSGAYEADRDNLAWITLLLFFREIFDRRNPRSALIDAALKSSYTPNGRYMTLVGTWFEVVRRLAGNLYELGRKGQVSEQNRALLEESIRLFDLLVEKDKRSSEPATRRKLVGMRGVAHLLIARGDEGPRAHYEAACRDLDESGRLGDCTLEHSQYLSEACIHCYDLTGVIKLVERAELVVSDAQRRHGPAPRLSFAAGEAARIRGFLSVGAGDYAGALRHFSDAEGHFTEAMARPDDSLSDNYLYMRRGQMRFKTLTAKYELEGSDDEQLLGLAIADLQRVGKDGSSVGKGGVTLPAALLLRASARRKRGEIPEALADYVETLSLCDAAAAGDVEDLRYRAEIGVWDCEIRRAIERGDAGRVMEGCEKLLAARGAAEYPIAALAHAVKFLTLNISYVEYKDLLLRTSAYIENYLREESGLVSSARYFAASHAARMLLLEVKNRPAQSFGTRDERSAHHSAQKETLERALRLYLEALEHSGEPPPELLSNMGETALRLAKICLVIGERAESLGYLQDACDYLERAFTVASHSPEDVSGRYSETVTHSKLGETYVRLHALTLDDSYAEKAIHHLRRSAELGNNTHENIGLLADAYYRRGRARDDRGDLLRAVELKQAAWECWTGERVRGAEDSRRTLRENRSVTAAAYSRLWRLVGDVGCLARAINAACEAASADENWSWPFFQLAEFAALAEQTRREAVAQIATTGKPSPLLRMVADGDQQRLYLLGSESAIRNSEDFEKKKLGGRSFVYELKDSHNLLRDSFVFKETHRGAAEREKGVAEKLEQYLARGAAPSYFELPKPLLVVPPQGDESDEVTYVMRRAHGRQLGELIIEWRECRTARSRDPLESARRTLQFLAFFHAWGLGGRDSVPRTTRADIYRLARDVTNKWRGLGLGDDDRRELGQRLRRIVPRVLPSLRRKDAHAENWLVGRRGQIIMLDLETQSFRPLGFEVAQLLEDYPLFSADETQWPARLAMYHEYLDVLRHLGVDLEEHRASAPATYAAFALFRAAFGLPQPPGGKRLRGKVLPTSAVRAASSRRRHYSDLVSFLEWHGPTTEIRECAAFIQEKAKLLIEP